MDNQKKQQLLKNTENLLLLKKEKSFKLFSKSIPMFYLSTGRSIFLLSILILFFILLKFLLFSTTNAVVIISEMAVNLNAIIIPIFTVIITGYAIFQALASGRTMITLISIPHKKEQSKFAIYNLYFYGIALFYLFLIVLNFILLFAFKFFPNDWYLKCFSITVNESIAAFLISFYLVVVLNFLLEAKSFIYNLFQVFITNASSTSIDYIENLKNNEGK